jgi:uncharacterized protein
VAGNRGTSEPDGNDALTPAALVGIVHLYSTLLRAYRLELDRLNVYPVPDGDTGTNLCLTVDHVVDTLDVTGPDDLLDAMPQAAVMGARGNSGVILAQGLRGLTGALQPDGGGPAEFAAALQEASRQAYRAVAEPVEGTILTVMRAAGEAAREQAARPGSRLVEVAEAAAAAGWDAVERTPELLPVLARAGVVDAGGKGYALFLDAAVAVIAGRPPAHPRPTAEVPDAAARIERAEHAAGPGFEVVCLLVAAAERVGVLRREWNELGDSVVIAGGGRQWRCHVHTDEVDAALALAYQAGTVQDVEVTDLARLAPDGEPMAGPTGPVAVVAVVSGAGSRHIALLLGASRVVANAPSATPSTRQLLDAVQACRPRDVVIVVDDHNVVPVAEQAAALTQHGVHVVPTHGLVEVLEALQVLDSALPAAELAARMTATAAALQWAKVQPVVREAATAVGRVSAGDWLAISRDGPVAAEPAPLDAAVAAATVLAEDDCTGFVILRGAAAGAADLDTLRAHLDAAYPDVSVEVYDSGEPHVAFTVAVRRSGQASSRG